MSSVHIYNQNLSRWTHGDGLHTGLAHCSAHTIENMLQFKTQIILKTSAILKTKLFPVRLHFKRAQSLTGIQFHAIISIPHITCHD